jgi:ornithine carbamoyltransferase
MTSLIGAELRLAVPGDAKLDVAVLEQARRGSGRVHRVETAKEAVEGADVVCTDAWPSVSALEGDAREARIRELAPFRVDASLLSHARAEHLVLHPLPAHRGLEITDDVLEGMRSVAFAQAKNRLPAQQALLEHLLDVGR